MLDALLESIGAVLLLGGCALATIGLYGLMRRRDLFEQLHAAGLVTGPAVILVLLAAIATGQAKTITSAVLVVVFVLVTSSLSVHAIALAGLHRYRPDVWEDGARGAADQARTISYAGTGARRMRVLLAHDGSPSAQTATRLASTLPWPSGTLVRVVGVTVEGLRPVGGRDEDEQEGLAESGSDLESALDSVAVELGAAGLSTESTLLRGDPALAIVGEARTFRADLVIVGTQTLDERSILAVSIAGEVVDRAPCPVLVARTPLVRHVLLPTDGSDASEAAMHVVARWPLFEAAHVRVTSVATTRGTHGTDDAAARSAEGAAAYLREHGREATWEVVAGSPAASIADLAARSGADLIVMGSRGRTGLTRTVLGSVSREVLKAADCSVLVINS